MRLSDWRAVAPRKDSMAPKVVATIEARSSMLGADADPECWVVWGDDPTIRYFGLRARAGRPGRRSTSASTCPGEGPRAAGKLIRWNRVQLGELAIEIQGGHRLHQLPGRGQRPPRLGRRRRRRRANSCMSCTTPSMGEPRRWPSSAATGPAPAKAKRRGRARAAPAPAEGGRHADRRGHLRPGRRARGFRDLVGRGPRRVRGRRTAARGRHDDQAAVMGANSRAWARIMRERLDLDLPDEAIERAIVEGWSPAIEREGAPRIDGAVEAVRRIAARWPVAIASSAHARGHRRGARVDRADRDVRGRGLVRRGRARQARAGRLPRGRAPARVSTRGDASSSRIRATGSGPRRPPG